MNKGNKPRYSFIILSIFLIILGASILSEPRIDPYALIVVLQYFMAGVGIVLFVAFLKLKKQFFSYELLIRCCIFITFSMMFFLLPAAATEVMKILIITLLIAEGSICLIVGISYILSKQKTWIIAIIAAALSASLAGWFITDESIWIYSMVDIIGLSTMVFGIISVVRFYFYHKAVYSKNVQLNLPSLGGITVAHIMLNAVKTNLRKEGFDHSKYLNSDDTDKEHTTVEIQVHLSDKGMNAIGHVDVVVDGKVYAFGNYDNSPTRKNKSGIFFDGVLAVCDRQQYMRFFLERTRKSIVCYEMDFDEKDLETIRGNIGKFLDDCERIIPEDIPENKFINTLASFNGEVFRVVRGRFATYFVLNANCSAFPETLLKDIRLHKIHSEGWTLMPGSIISFCENQLTMDGSPVVARRIYLSKKFLERVMQARPARISK